MRANFAPQSPLHVAVIPEGCGCWHAGRGRASERAGADAVRRVVGAAPALGVGILTFQGLSSDGTQEPADAVLSGLAGIGAFLARETPGFLRSGVRVTVFGEREGIPADVRGAIEVAEQATAGETGLQLRIAIGCSARRAILAMFLRGLAGPALLGESTSPLGPDVDLLIRTGGERRLADFLLWECANAELCFVDTPWSEFGERELAAAVAELHRRERRLTGVPPQDTPSRTRRPR